MDSSINKDFVMLVLTISAFTKCWKKKYRMRAWKGIKGPEIFLFVWKKEKAHKKGEAKYT